jgi:PleD family two-component response regulator
MRAIKEIPVKQAPDEIAIVTQTPARAEVLKQAIILRGFDEIVCLDAARAGQAFRTKLPVLVIVDMEGDVGKTVSFLDALPAGVRSIVLADAFEESLFVSCYDRGARDFMVNPVPEAILVSRVIRNLQEHRLEEMSSQKDQILVAMNVLSAQSGVFTTPYLINLLRRHAEEIAGQSIPEPISLLILQLEGYESPLPEEVQAALMSQVGATIKECARGLDEVGEYFLDKFAVIMPQTSSRGAKALANRLKERLQGLVFQGAHGPLTLGLQVGVAEYKGCRHYEDFLSRALDDLKRSASIVSPSLEVSQAKASVPKEPQNDPAQAPMLASNVSQPAMSRPSNLI